LGKQTSLEYDDDSHAVEEMPSSPSKLDVNLVLGVRHLDQPESLGHETAYTEVAIDDEAQGRKLTGAVTDQLASLFALPRNHVLQCQRLHAREGCSKTEV